MAVNVLICDDHRLFADSLAVALAAHGFDVFAPTYHPADAVAFLACHQVDVCIIDRQFPDADGRDGIREIQAASARTAVIMLSGSAEPGIAAEALAAGASAFAAKDEGIAHIAELIQRVSAGEVVTATTPTALRRAPAGGAGALQPGHELARFLTRRELEVLSRLVQGHDTARLAADMGITYATARTHIQNLLTKLGVHSKLEAVAFAVSNNLVAAST